MRKNKKLILVIFFVIQLLFMSQLKHYPEFVEQFYSNGLYVFLSKLMRYVFGWMSFSVGDLLYTLAGLYVIRWLIVNRKRVIKDTLNWLLDIGSTLSIAYFAFHILWAFNYYRQPLYQSLNLEAEYTTEQLISFTERLIEKSNTLQIQLTKNDTLKVNLPYSKSEIFDKVKDGYHIMYGGSTFPAPRARLI